MKTQIQIQTITFSKAAIILKCCAIAFTIACAVSLAGKVDTHQFMQNILDWESI